MVTMQSFRAIDDKQIGVFIHTEFPGNEPADFIHAVYHQPPLIPRPNVNFAWKTPNVSQEKLFYWCQYNLHSKAENLTLFDAPRSSPWDFFLEDIEFPYKRVGCILIINLYQAFSLKVSILNQGHLLPLKKEIELRTEWEEKAARSMELLSKERVVTEFKRVNQGKNRNHWQRGGAGWIKKSKLPFVILAIEPDAPTVSLDEVLDALDLGREIPIVRCSLHRNLTDMKTPEYPFKSEDIERTLLALVDVLK